MSYEQYYMWFQKGQNKHNGFALYGRFKLVLANFHFFGENL